MWWGEEAQTEKENQQFLYLDIVFATCVQLYAKSAFDVWMMLLKYKWYTQSNAWIVSPCKIIRMIKSTVPLPHK